MLTMMAALATVQGEQRYKFYDKIYVTASPESVNKNLYTGFKPGETANKLGGHLGGFKSNLKFLLDPKRVKESRKKTNPDEAELQPSDVAWLKYFTVKELDEIQGESVHYTILLLDEWQKLSDESAKLSISRISEGSKLVLIGDTRGQVYGLNRGNEGFKRLYKHLGKAPKMAYIKMDNIYRSELAQFVAEIYKD